jgi:radical SAM superfamily enzyme YgiQ (UPF0313 family)
MFRVALVRAFSQSDYKEPAEPLGIEALAAILHKNGIEFRLFDRELDSLETVARAVVEYQPSLLGISVLMGENAADATRLILKVRKKITVACVIGGLFVTTCSEEAEALFPHDCELVAGEGETALLRIISKLTGTVYPDSDRKCLLPDEWPWLYRYRLQDYLNMGAPINMRSSRGCPGRCRFCATPSMPHGLNKWQGRNVADVADEMESLCAQYTPHAFNFVDDDFGPLSRVEELTDELKKRGLRCALSLQLRAEAMCREPNLGERTRKLKENGLSRVFIGLESFDRSVLAYFNKEIEPEKSLKVFQTMRASGVAVHIGYILWHPYSTVDSIRREARLLKDAGFFTTKIVMAKLQMFPGCELRREQPREGFTMPVDDYFEIVRSITLPLYNVWLKGALDVPLRYCLAHEEPNGDAPRKVREIEREMGRLDELSFQILLDPDSTSASAVLETAEDVKKRLREIG